MSLRACARGASSETRPIVPQPRRAVERGGERPQAREEVDDAEDERRPLDHLARVEREAELVLEAREDPRRAQDPCELEEAEQPDQLHRLELAHVGAGARLLRPEDAGDRHDVEGDDRDEVDPEPAAQVLDGDLRRVLHRRAALLDRLLVRQPEVDPHVGDEDERDDLVDDEERVDLHLVDERHLDRRDEEREQQRADREEVPVLDELAVEVDQPAVHRLHAPRQLVDVRLQLVRVELRVRLLVGHVRGALRLDLRAQHLHLRGRRRGDPAALPRRRRRGPARELVVVEALHAHSWGRGRERSRVAIVCCKIGDNLPSG